MNYIIFQQNESKFEIHHKLSQQFEKKRNLTQYKTKISICFASIAKQIQVQFKRKSYYRVHIKHECHFYRV